MEAAPAGDAASRDSVDPAAAWAQLGAAGGSRRATRVAVAVAFAAGSVIGIALVWQSKTMAR
jgi:hypothetical protein